MKEQGLNIWGKKGCELPNGSLCIACCVLPEVELEGTYVSVSKPANSPCPYLSNGCSLHLIAKPNSCKEWHCSMADLNGKLDLIAQALSLNQVTESKAAKFASRLSREGKTYILAKSQELSKITYKRDLVIRDLTEP